MTPERWREIERVYHAALAAAPEARDAVLAEACAGDDGLRCEVESLLAQASVSGVLDHSPDDLTKGLASRDPRAASGAGQTLRRVGPFELQALLGAGGMGEVYRARDTRLGRDVAVKILPGAFKDDPGRVARFAREARVLASLNHPHIAALYGLEEADGISALVMELVEGDDLSRPTAWRMDQAIAIAKQIAEALEAAHERGIIHRDLKPGNIRLRPDGTVKVLDFGLATALESSPDDVRILAARQTRTGVLVGTPAYMSPEQARGESVGRHVDIWAFGVVVYELLTGVCPFARPTTAETLASILSEQPDYSRLPAETPQNVRRLIRRCCEKDLKRRLQHIGDARLELEEALTPPAADVPSRAPAADWRSQKALRIAVLVAAMVALAGASGFWLARRPVPVPAPVVRTTVPADTFISGTDRDFVFTPGGRALAYIGSEARQIFVRPLDALQPVPILTTAAYIKGTFPSPDGRWFGYIENNFVLKKVPAAGGSPMTLLTMDGPSRGAAWGADDTILFATGATDTGLQRVAASGGPVTVLTRPNPQGGEADHVNPVWLPGGRHVLFTITAPQRGLDAAKVAVLDLATGAWRTLLEGGYDARYVEGGYLVYAAAGALWATRFDLERLETQGAPREMLRPVSVGTLGAVAEFDIATDGALAYSRGAITQGRRLPVWVDRSGRETPLQAPHSNYTHPRFSPDGRRLALVAYGDIYVWDWTRPWSTASRLTFDPRIDWYPVWTPDSRRILFGSWRAGGFSNLYSYDLETGSTERLTDSPDMQLPTAITRDGTTLIFHSFARSIQALRLPVRAAPVTLVETPVDERNGELSPDGRWLAYEGENALARGDLDVYVRSFPDVDRGLWQVSRGGGMYPMWARNGRELFYVTLDGTMVSVPVEASGTTWKMGDPTPLFRHRYDIREGSLGRMFDVAPDGRFLMIKNESSVDAAHIVLVQNWVAELTQQVR